MVKITQEKTESKKVVVAVECDRCHKVYHEAEEGEPIMTKDGFSIGTITDQRDMWELPEMHHIDFVGGYGSVFGDRNRVQCDLCQHCLKEVIGPFARIEEY